MSSESGGKCPGCRGTLEPLQAGRHSRGWRCGACGVVCLRESDLSPEGKEKLAQFRDRAASQRLCPGCSAPMTTVAQGLVEIERCRPCGMIAFDPGETLDPKRSGSFDALFALSIPERAIRSLVGTAGATARELTHVLVPPVVRGTRFWNAAIERSLKILSEGVGNVKSRSAAPQEVDVARMAVGSVVDTAALVVFHVSPLWLLAAVHDVAKGSRRYLDEVVEELKDRGALAREEHIEGIDHLLTVLEKTSGELQSDVDLPPLSVKDLRASLERVRETVVSSPEGEAQAKARDLARELEAVSKREGRSLREISNAISVRAVSGAKLAGVAAVAGVDVARRILVEEGWRPYFEQLAAVRRQGFSQYLADAARPIAEAVEHNFNPQTDTLTAQLVSGRLWKRALSTLRGPGK